MLKVIPEDCRCVRDDKHYIDMAHIYQEYEKGVYFSKFRKKHLINKIYTKKNLIQGLLYLIGASKWNWFHDFQFHIKSLCGCERLLQFYIISCNLIFVVSNQKSFHNDKLSLFYRSLEMMKNGHCVVLVIEMTW